MIIWDPGSSCETFPAHLAKSAWSSHIPPCDQDLSYHKQQQYRSSTVCSEASPGTIISTELYIIKCVYYIQIQYASNLKLNVHFQHLHPVPRSFGINFALEYSAHSWFPHFKHRKYLNTYQFLHLFDAHSLLKFCVWVWIVAAARTDITKHSFHELSSI